VFGQWTPSKRLRHVPALLRSRANLLSNPSPHLGAGAVSGSVTGILDRRGARPVQLPHVEDRPNGCAPHQTVTVVICAHSEVRWGDLVAVVASVKQQAYRAAEIVLVVDHNPKLQRRSTVELPGVQVIPNDNNSGLPGARNAGVAAATSEIVAFVDDDSVAAHNWLAALVHPMPTHTCSASADRWCPTGGRGVRTGSRPSSTGSLDAVTAACPRSEPRCTTSLVETCRCGVASLSNPAVSMPG
jgi:hypothetical protein